MADGDSKNESGNVLLLSLGLIILLSLLIGGIFFLARGVYSQVTKVDDFKRINEVQDFAMQDGATKIQQMLEAYFHSLDTVDFGQDTTKIGKEMDELFQGFVIKDDNLGSENQFSYNVRITSIDKQKITPYIITNSDGNFGWKQDVSAMNSSKATNVRLTFVLTAEVLEKRKDRSSNQRTSESHFVYEIQWNDVDVTEEETELDVWRNIVYSYYLPNGVRFLSADEWSRKMQKIYGYNTNIRRFNYSSFDPNTVTKEGYQNGRLIDFTDGSRLDFSSSGKAIQNLVEFDASFLFENGILLEGVRSNANLLVHNLLSIRTNGYNMNMIKDIGIEATNGIMIDMEQKRDYLAVMAGKNDIKTSALLISNTQTSENARNVAGFALGNGQLLLSNLAAASEFTFANYTSNAQNHSPQDNYWSEFTKGSLVVASAGFYAGPLDLGNQLVTTSEDQRHIIVDGNFLVSNASWDAQRKAFSYFDNQEKVTPNPPSKILLTGRNTQMVVKGQTFIDTPKINKRTSVLEKKDNGEDVFYTDSTAWNMIELRGGASLLLDYTGTEPFHLEMDADSLLSMKLLPGLALFDTEFLKLGFEKEILQGKIILNPFNKQDVQSLSEKFDAEGIPYNVTTDEKVARNGEVTIIDSQNATSKYTSQVITRTFSYVEKIKY